MRTVCRLLTIRTSLFSAPAQLIAIDASKASKAQKWLYSLNARTGGAGVGGAALPFFDFGYRYAVWGGSTQTHVGGFQRWEVWFTVLANASHSYSLALTPSAKKHRYRMVAYFEKAGFGRLCFYALGPAHTASVNNGYWAAFAQRTSSIRWREKLGNRCASQPVQRPFTGATLPGGLPPLRVIWFSTHNLRDR